MYASTMAHTMRTKTRGDRPSFWRTKVCNVIYVNCKLSARAHFIVQSHGFVA